MATFNFPYHTLEVSYPTQPTVQFGRGYEFAAKPRGPDQVLYTLNFNAMRFFLNSNGTYNKTTQPALNMALLEDFYVAHRMYETFTYPHQALGNLTMRFAQPLHYRIIPGGNGVTEPFSIQMRLQP